jgi:hypothetical protein
LVREAFPSADLAAQPAIRPRAIQIVALATSCSTRTKVRDRGRIGGQIQRQPGPQLLEADQDFAVPFSALRILVLCVAKKAWRPVGVPQ